VGEASVAWAQGWCDAYAAAWRSGDLEAAIDLFTDDVVYRSHPFREPLIGREAVAGYTRSNFEVEREVVPRFGDPSWRAIAPPWSPGPR
jgi:ketosteroid isomerase-like protein